jgi:hypothetical protein
VNDIPVALGDAVRVKRSAGDDLSVDRAGAARCATTIAPITSTA